MQLATKRWRTGVLILTNALLILLLALPASAFHAAADAATGATGDVRLLSADAGGVRLALSAPAFELAEAQVTPSATEAASRCDRVAAAGLVLSEEEGRPQLPVKVVLLGAPPGASLSLAVDAAPSRTVASGVALCATSPVSTTEAAGGATAPDASLVDAFYPTETVRLIDLGFMRSQRIVRVEIYPFQYNPVSQELRVSDEIEVSVRFEGGQPGGFVSEPPAVEAGFERSLVNYEAARPHRSAGAESTASLQAAWTPPQPGYKILVREEGIYQLTRTALASAGLPVDQLDPRTLRLYNEGQEVPLRVIGEEDGRLDAADVALFYGQGADTRYTDTNVYWLGYGGSAGLRMATRPSVAGGVAASSFFSSVKKEDNLLYDSDLPMLPGYNHWWGQTITAAGAGKSATLNITVATPDLATGTETASVSVLLGGVATGPHHVRLYVNPASHPDSVWNGIFDGTTAHLASATFPQSYLVGTGNNTIRIELINDAAGRPADIVRLDWLRVGYQHKLAAAGDQLIFGGDATGARRYSVSGFTASGVDLYDVTAAGCPAIIDWMTETPATSSVFLPLILGPRATAASVADTSSAEVAAPSFTLTFGDKQATPRRYLAQTAARRLSPLSITLDQPSSLASPAAGADLIVITHADFASAVQPLANHRAAKGARVQVVDVQDVYDEFGGGLMSAEAIRDFIAHAYSNWPRPAPASVLLVGDGTYDLRQYRSAVPTFIPPFLELVDPDAGETATDNRFVAVTAGDILPDLDIGRLPVNSAAEATAMVNKILAYEGQAAAPWMKQVLFVTDDLEGGGGDFYAYSDGIADGSTTYKGAAVKILPVTYTASKIYLGRTCDLSNPATSVECRAQIINKINSGSLMVSYVGHGVKTYWAAEHLFDTAALANVNNGGRLPVMLPMTCNEGYFIDPAESSLSELGVRAENKGAIASWSPTGYGLAPGHDFLERGLFLSVFHDGAALGSGATMAKLYLVANAPPGKYLDLIDTFLLLGDPGLQVP